MFETIKEAAREIPVTHEIDLVIAGGGTAGVACAVCAARLGLSVIMVENTGQPGGMVTHVTQWTGDFDNKGGFPREFLDYVLSKGVMKAPYYNPFPLVRYFDHLLKEAGVLPLYLCRVVAPLISDNRLEGVIIESKQGRHVIKAKMVVDATGDGDVAANAGADFFYGRESDGLVQSLSLTHFVQNFVPDIINLKKELLPVLKRLNPEYELPYDHGNFRRQAGTKNGLMIAVPHVTGCNPLNAESLSGAMIEMREQATELFDLLRKTEFGAELEFGAFSAIPGVRESRRIVCDDFVTDEEIYNGSSSDDGLFTVAHNIDIHKCTPEEPPIIVKKVKPYQIRYGSLLPKGLERIMVIGRCIGGSHEALASYRLISDCFGMGEAAALAIEQAINANSELRSIPLENVRAEMLRRGYQL